MGKNKKKKAQMFRNFLAFKAGQGSQNNQVANVNQPPLSFVQGSQLSSFQTPHGDQEKLTELLDDNVGGGPNQPDGSGTPRADAQKISKWTALKPAEDTSNIVHTKQDKRPNLTIVEGTASNIQLVIDKTKKSSTQLIIGSTTLREPKSNNPIESVPSVQTIKPTYMQPATAQIPVQTYNIPIPPPLTVPKFPYNMQKEKTAKNTPSWIPAHHPKPVWQAQKPLPQANQNQGSGWPKQKTQNPSFESNIWHAGIQSAMNDVNVQIDTNVAPPQAYSPSDIYTEGVNNERPTDEEMESSETLPPGLKRLSAFQRLGPMAEQAKKPKLTINLLCQKDVRNVVDETDDIPTHLRDYITTSTNDIVVKYLDVWPFRKNIVPARTATARQSKSVMMLETEYMEEAYSRDNRFILVVVTGYPQNWKKEDVLDAVLDSVKGNSFIPCFIEFSRIQCKFLVIRSRLALLAIHKYGFIIRKDDIELIVSLSNVHLNLNQLDFVPRLILRKLLASKLDGASLDLSNFTTKNDISHFIYFPLYRSTNQMELIQLQSTVPWECLTSLDLSHNRLTTITGIDLSQTTPKLQHLNLSHNCIEKITILLHCRGLPLKTVHLEGNPLCYDYIEKEHYIKVLTMMFSGLVEIDGVPIKELNDLPNSKRNYCPQNAKLLIDKVLEVFFPLLDASQEQRYLMEEMYDENAIMTITFMYKLRYSPVYKDYRNLFNRARVMDEGDMESLVGPEAIVKAIRRWPDLIHDPCTFNVDVLHHSDTATIVRIGGIVKITAQSLADDEYLLAFTRTLVLHTKDGTVYKITNELLYWDLPEKNYAETAFQITRVKPKTLSLRLDVSPDKDLKEKLLAVFMQITELDKGPSERCLEEKDWNIKNALEYFTKLLKLNNLDPIMRN